MKLPLLITREDFDAIKPRKHLGQRADLSADQKDMLDVIDVMDQRSLWLAEAVITNRIIVLVVFAACLPQIYLLIQTWLKNPP